MSCIRIGFLFPLVYLGCIACAEAAIVFGLPGDGTLRYGSRWNASATSFDSGQGVVERSLDGGLRYSVAGGNY